MSSAKAALEADTRTLAFEAGRRWGVRVNAISAGPWASRAATAIGFIDMMITYAAANSPLPRPIEADDVGSTAAFLCSPLARAIPLRPRSPLAPIPRQRPHYIRPPAGARRLSVGGARCRALPGSRDRRGAGYGGGIRARPGRRL